MSKQHSKSNKSKQHSKSNKSKQHSNTHQQQSQRSSPMLFAPDQEVNAQQIISQIKQLIFNNKSIEKNIQRIKKDLEIRPTQNGFSQLFAVMNSLIQIDPSLSKMLKTKQVVKNQNQYKSLLNNTAEDLGRKINHISESVALIYGTVKTMQKKITQIQFQSKATLTEKTSILQQQIDQSNSKISGQLYELNQKIQISVTDFNSKLRQIESKTLWQINDSKMKISNCAEKDQMNNKLQNFENSIMGKLKDFSLSQGAIDPQKINEIQQSLLTNERKMMKKITQNEYKIQKINNDMYETVFTKKQNTEQRIENQERMAHFNKNITQIVERLRITQNQTHINKLKRSQISNQQEQVRQKIKDMSQILKNLNISAQFQQLLSNINPHQISMLDDKVQKSELEQQQLKRDINNLQKQLNLVRSRTEFDNILMPNSGTPKLQKEDVQKIVDEYYVNNMLIKKVNNLQIQLSQIKVYPDMLSQMNKKLARALKETNTNNILSEINSLQQFVNQQNSFMNKRISYLQKVQPPTYHQSYDITPKIKNFAHQRRSDQFSSQKKLAPLQSLTSYEKILISSQKKDLTRRQ